jgi:hypothetical protein
MSTYHPKVESLLQMHRTPCTPPWLRCWSCLATPEQSVGRGECQSTAEQAREYRNRAETGSTEDYSSYHMRLAPFAAQYARTGMAVSGSGCEI